MAAAKAGTIKGVGLGLAAALLWAVYNVGVEIGRAEGFTSADLAILRYGVAGLILAPLLAMQWRKLPPSLTLPRAIMLSCIIGPPFAFLFNTGYGLAPLAHAVVISPGMSMLVANMLPILLDGQRLSVNRKLGIAVLIIGLMAIAADRPVTTGSGDTAILGDLCFVGSGSLWGVFIYLMARWRLPAIATTAATSILSAVFFLPFYILYFDPAPLPLAAWIEQAIYQGAIGGSLAIIVFASSISLLGSGLAGLFPALVPPLAVLLAIPLARQWPNALQTLGVVIASGGLIVSLDQVARFLRPKRYDPDRVTDRR
ncbi:DMT family transporter [Hoeflea sp.]|uniref:DMT family transporter n=1 Tax=Hoeflea sp. TaxID=1940281 RepID=UPI003A952795